VPIGSVSSLSRCPEAVIIWLMSGRCTDALGTVQGESCCETFLRMCRLAWATRTLMLPVVGSMLMACTSEKPEPEEPSVSAFCAAVERAPKDDVSVAETQAAAADVEGVSPPEIQDEVIALRDALRGDYRVGNERTLSARKPS
jgi:hypothetical protein